MTAHSMEAVHEPVPNPRTTDERTFGYALGCLACRNRQHKIAKEKADA